MRGNYPLKFEPQETTTKQLKIDKDLLIKMLTYGKSTTVNKTFSKLFEEIHQSCLFEKLRHQCM